MPLRRFHLAIFIALVSLTALGLPLHGQFFLEIEELAAVDRLLQRPLGVAISPDGDNVYVVSHQSNTLLGYDRDPSTGALEQTILHVHGADGVNGLHSPLNVIVSGDGEHVYTAARKRDPVGIFDRDLGTGVLSFAGSLDPSVLPTFGKPWDLALSADGSSLYVATDDAVLTFSRDPSNGLLTTVDVDINNAGGIEGLHGARGIAVSPDGEQVYVTGMSAHSLLVFDRDPGSGALTFQDREINLIGGVFGLHLPTKVALDSSERLFAVSDRAVVFSRDSTTGNLTFTQRLHSTATPGLPDFPSAVGGLSPGGQHYYLLGTKLAVFGVPDLPGSLSLVQVIDDVGAPPLGSQGLGIAGDGNDVYVANASENSLLHFARNSVSGELSLVSEQHGPLFGDEILFDVSDLIVSADGKNVYATAGCCDRGVLVFSRSDSGRLTLVEEVGQPVIARALRSAETDGSTMISLSPDQAHVYWASPSGVSVFGRSAGDGSLTFQQTATGGSLGEAQGLAVSSDGNHLYAVHPSFDHDPTVVTFSRDAGGNLTFVDQIVSSTYPFDLVISPDGQHVYVSGSASVSVFARDASNGELTLLEIQRDGVAGITALDGSRGLAISADGMNLYVAAAKDQALVVFSRDTTSGFLTLVEEHENGSMGVSGLDTAVDVALSEATGEVYVQGSFHMPLIVFDRDPSDGSLQFVGLEEGESLVGAPRAVAASPDGSYVYLAVPRGVLRPRYSSVAVMARAGIFADGFESGDTSRWSEATQ